jgi:uncharacterized protein (DUF58 family)
MVLGVAGVTAGNNLLFLLLGASLGTIVLSGILSEEAIRGIRIRLRAVGGPEVGKPARLRVEWCRDDGRTPAYALCLDERRAGLLHRESFRRAAEGLLRSDLPSLKGRRAETWATRTFPRRGRAELHRCELATLYPFGLLRKVRDVDVEVDVWVRPARVELPPALRAGRGHARQGVASMRRGHGVEAYGLREWTERDPVHRIHALRSARHSTDVMVETAREEQPVLWIGVVNANSADREALDRACELAAAYARDREASGRRVGLASVGAPPVDGDLEALLDRLARLVPTSGPQTWPPGTIVFCPSGATAPEDVRVVRVDARGSIA